MLAHRCAGGQILPGDDGLQAVADEALRVRMATLFGFGLMLEQASLLTPEGIAAFHDLHSRDLRERAAVVTDPVLRIWLRRALGITALATTPAGEVPVLGREDHEHLARFPEVVAHALAVGGPMLGNIAVRRHDVDPLLKAVAPPTYEFPPDDVEVETAYGLDLFAAVASVALERIGLAWPELHAVLPRFVRTMIHVPDGTFRSASAARFSGAVFFSADDHSVFDLEESIVHEFGHQILYEAMELDPLVRDGESTTHVLPWSGAERDWYGYFHAFFIYVLLAEYLTRRRQVACGVDPDHERRRVTERLDQIVAGIEAALPDVLDGSFTIAGREVIEAMAVRARQLTTAATTGTRTR